MYLEFHIVISFLTYVVKQNVIENIVPILIAVKHKLEEQRSPLMKHLLLYLKELMKDYKNEVREILAGDKQLAKEIEFDLRRFDKEQWEEKNQLASEKSNAGELQLHSTSPTSHKHESDFSRLRKTSKDMQQDPIESSKDKAKVSHIMSHHHLLTFTLTLVYICSSNTYTCSCITFYICSSNTYIWCCNIFYICSCSP
ncbi:hypothetical protein O3P69_011980 [Scylla paramamosain]|uniref:Uncharacterized protein n=1 Tax=Scylla paramamosain TaxID=85552 RepID=A0AAW0SAR5_SCYPA